MGVLRVRVGAGWEEITGGGGGGGGTVLDAAAELQYVSDIAQAFTQQALVTVQETGTVSGQFVSTFMLDEFLFAGSAGAALDAINGASATHTHDAVDLTGFQTLVDSSSIQWTDTGTTTSGAVVAISASVITSGTLADARIPSGIARDTELAAGYQPLNSDLTAIGALTTTTFGRSLLTAADAAAARAMLGI